MGEVYKINIAGCDRELPICPIDDHMDIAGFVMFSDVEITERTAQALMEKCPEHDVISTGESLAAMEELLHAIGGKVVGKACVLAEGDAKDRTDIIYLEPLPLFFK